MAADGSIIIDTKIDGSGFNALGSSVSGLPKILGKIGGAISAAFAVGKIVDFAKEAINLGSDLQEVQNVVDVTFGTMNEQMNAFAENAVFVSGLSETMAKKFAGTFGAMAKSFGFTEEEAFSLATTLTTLSGDVASFYNLTQEEAYTKLKSVFTGETEALKDLGVVMTQAALDAYALEQGIGKTTAQMTEQEKVALRYSFVMDQLSAASGDFARTSGSWANQTRILSVQFDQLKATIGQGLINALTPVIQVINTILAGLQRIANAFRTLTAALFGDASQLSGGTTAQELQGVADGYQAAAGGAGDLAENTKKAAQEAKKAIAPFDELTKLANPETGGGSGGGGGGGGGFASIGDVGKIPVDAEVEDKLTPKITAIVEKLKNVFQPVVDGLKDIWNWIRPVFDFLGNVALDTLDTFAYYWEMLTGVFEENGPKIRNILSGIGELVAMVWYTIEPILSFAWATVVGLFRDIADVIGITLTSIITVLNGLIEFIIGVFAMDWERAWNGLVEIFTGIWTGLKDLAQFIWDGIVEIFNSIVSTIQEVIGAIGGFFGFTGGGSSGATAYAAPSLSAYAVTPDVPYLAKGAVIPPNSKFMAVLGDQKSGVNVEAPLATIQQALRDVMAERGEEEINITFTGSLAQLARVLQPEIHRAERNATRAKEGRA